MKKVVVLGSTGMAGHVVSRFLEERGFDVFRASRSEKDTPKSKAIDVFDLASLHAWLGAVSPDVVINCIGLLQSDCEARPDRAIFVNSYFPHWLEHAFNQTNVRIIHLSTDCVFSGLRGGYIERDIRDGQTMYDRSKALGELENEKDLTLRMSIIGPDTDSNGTGLFNWFMRQNGEILGYSHALWNGVTTIELSRAISSAIEDGLTGLYHLVGAPIDKFHLLERFQAVFGRDVRISRDASVTIDKTLVNTRRDFDFTVKSHLGQIEDMRDWVERHRGMYSHYEV